MLPKKLIHKHYDTIYLYTKILLKIEVSIIINLKLGYRHKSIFIF